MLRTALTPVALVVALVGCNGARLDEVDAGQTSQDARIAELEAENTALQEALDTLSAEVDGLDNGYSDRVQAAEDGLAALEGRMDTTETAVEDHDARLDSAEARLTAVEADIVSNGAADGATLIRLIEAEEGIVTNADAIAANTALIDTHATDISDNASAITSNGATISDNGASIADIEAQLSDFDTTLSELDDAKLTLVDTDTTLAVPGTYSTIQAALDSLDQTRIVNFATVTIEVADGTHAQPDVIIVDHPDGHLIEIVGASGDPSRATLSFTGTSGMYIPVGRTLGNLEGITLRGNGGGSSRYGLWVTPNAFAQLDDVVIRNFSGDCIYTFGNGTITSPNDSVTVENCDGDGVEAGWGSVLIAQGLIAEDNGGYGLHIRDGAFADVDEGDFSNNGLDGIRSRSYAFVSAAEATVDNNGEYGLVTFRYGVIDASDAVLSNNDQAGAYATIHGLINAYGTNTTNNGTYGFLATNYGEIDARVATTSGNPSGASTETTGASVYE